MNHLSVPFISSSFSSSSSSSSTPSSSHSHATVLPLIDTTTTPAKTDAQLARESTVPGAPKKQNKWSILRKRFLRKNIHLLIQERQWRLKKQARELEVMFEQIYKTDLTPLAPMNLLSTFDKMED